MWHQTPGLASSIHSTRVASPQEQELRMLQQIQPLPEHCAWGRSAPPLHYIAWVGIPHPDVMTPTITEPTAEGAVLGIPITFENGWPVHSPDEPSDDDEDGQGSSCGARDPRQTSLLQSCSSSGSCRNADADRDRPHLLSPRLMAMSRAEPEELRAPGLARMSSMSSSGDGNAFSNGPVLGGAPGAAAPALPGETD